MKIIRRLNIQRFTALDSMIYVCYTGFQAAEYGSGRISLLEMGIRISVLILVWGTISVFLQLYLRTKSLNGFSCSEDIDTPRY